MMAVADWSGLSPKSGEQLDYQARTTAAVGTRHPARAPGLHAAQRPAHHWARRHRARRCDRRRRVAPRTLRHRQVRRGAAVITTAAVLLQTVLNLEMARYTLYTGEPIVTGFMRTWPGP